MLEEAVMRFQASGLVALLQFSIDICAFRAADLDDTSCADLFLAHVVVAMLARGAHSRRGLCSL